MSVLIEIIEMAEADYKMLSGAVDKTSSSFSAHGKIGNFIFIKNIAFQIPV